MRNVVTGVMEFLVGALLIGLGLLYLESQYKALSRMTDAIAQETINDTRVLQQYSFVNINQISDEELCASIMGYREYPIMLDDRLIPLKGHDYDLYLTYIRDGYYKKEYQYEADRRILMIRYTYMGM